jgi:hypothetical protein
MSENKTNFTMAVRGYKSVKRHQNANSTEITALDNSNNKVLLRIIEPLTTEYIGINDVRNFAKAIKQDNFDSAILISKQFTDNALEEMNKENIQYISDDYMPPFDIQNLYLAIVNCANSQCQKKCGKVLLAIAECTEKASDLCKTKALAVAAKRHFEERTVGLMKNDLKLALALTR